MRNERIAFLLAVCGLFFVPPAKAQSVPKTTKRFHPPPIEDMYVSWKGQPITEIGLSPRELTDVLSKVLRTGMDDEDLRSPAALKKELQARHVEMGYGADNGLVVNGRSELCGGTGNCATWFFRRSQAKWRLVLDGSWPAAFAFIPPKHSGLLDLVLVMHLNAGEAPTDVWQFNGIRYQLVKSYCWYSSGQTEEGSARNQNASVGPFA
jgi:hypothetical protein